MSKRPLYKNQNVKYWNKSNLTDQRPKLIVIETPPTQTPQNKD